MKERRKYPRVKSVSDSHGSTFVRTKRRVVHGIARERWEATVTTQGPPTITVASDSLVLMEIDASEIPGLGLEPVNWSNQHANVPVKSIASRFGPTTLGNHLVVEVSMKRP